jgi:hypothetical protein
MRNTAERHITKQGDARAEAETSPGTAELYGTLRGVAYDVRAGAETSLNKEWPDAGEQSVA